VTFAIRIHAVTILLAISTLASSGCTSAEVTGEPASVSGTVICSGQLLPFGMIEFQNEDNDDLSRLVKIVDGKYALDEQQGLVSGDYAVRVLPFEPEVEELSQFSKEQRQGINVARRLIPERYQKAGALKATLSSDKPNVVNFDLKR
jgi:hypothetical protein